MSKKDVGRKKAALLRAAESLTRDSAKASHFDTCPFSSRRMLFLTSQQAVLSIPPHVVFLAGLSVVVDAAAVADSDAGASNEKNFTETISTQQGYNHKQQSKVWYHLQTMYQQSQLSLVEDTCAEMNELKNNHGEGHDGNTVNSICHRKKALQMYHWSPTLLPSPEWQVNIKKQVLQRLKELHQQSLENTQHLLQQEQTLQQPDENRPTHKRKTTRMKQKQNRSKEHCTKQHTLQTENDLAIEVDENDTETTWNCPMSEDSSSKTNITSASNGNNPVIVDTPWHDQDDSSDNTLEWIPIHRKASKKPISTKILHGSLQMTRKSILDPDSVPGTLPRTTEIQTSQWKQQVHRLHADHLSSTNTSSIMVFQPNLQQPTMEQEKVDESERNEVNPSSSSSSSILSQSRTTKTNDSTVEQGKTMREQSAFVIHPNELSKDSDDGAEESDNDDNDKDTTIDILRTRLQQLKCQLRHAYQMIAEHERQLILVQEEKYDAVQALQLRLYIAETRWKAYEEALHRHNQQVAENVSSTVITASSDILVHDSSSSGTLLSRLEPKLI